MFKNANGINNKIICNNIKDIYIECIGKEKYFKLNVEGIQTDRIMLQIL